MAHPQAAPSFLTGTSPSPGRTAAAKRAHKSHGENDENRETSSQTLSTTLPPDFEQTVLGILPTAFERQLKNVQNPEVEFSTPQLLEDLTGLLPPSFRRTYDPAAVTHALVQILMPLGGPTRNDSQDHVAIQYRQGTSLHHTAQLALEEDANQFATRLLDANSADPAPQATYVLFAPVPGDNGLRHHQSIQSWALQLPRQTLQPACTAGKLGLVLVAVGEALNYASEIGYDRIFREIEARIEQESVQCGMPKMLHNGKFSIANRFEQFHHREVLDYFNEGRPVRYESSNKGQVAAMFIMLRNVRGHSAATDSELVKMALHYGGNGLRIVAEHCYRELPLDYRSMFRLRNNKEIPEYLDCTTNRKFGLAPAHTGMASCPCDPADDFDY